MITFGFVYILFDRKNINIVYGILINTITIMYGVIEILYGNSFFFLLILENVSYVEMKPLSLCIIQRLIIIKAQMLYVLFFSSLRQECILNYFFFIFFIYLIYKH